MLSPAPSVRNQSVGIRASASFGYLPARRQLGRSCDATRWKEAGERFGTWYLAVLPHRFCRLDCRIRDRQVADAYLFLGPRDKLTQGGEAFDRNGTSYDNGTRIDRTMTSSQTISRSAHPDPITEQTICGVPISAGLGSPEDQQIGGAARGTCRAASPDYAFGAASPVPEFVGNVINTCSNRATAESRRENLF